MSRSHRRAMSHRTPLLVLGGAIKASTLSTPLWAGVQPFLASRTASNRLG
ncbi:hypothetical protein F441_06253 [Phytophthora nicotianae CJ01A1]|uniref:Uncharacterized protein n=6 Tax=Phytophthora nicotianae TaxID=4792 RepID=W2RAN5_PHYN3|nr:hypothetical protein PPTG_20924 [Phytophthora nicotianae INRA-310]ETI50122.1 hypothetical protein F443_06245 [Phytophthora nicotianae P1569]ETK90002.1 hypothetical protein L915_06126 [Phytophthora nicotianae]ETO78847.1 hypothetical protein F444_06310 [Phytophthora nicotianae P1976]ETP19901.1 hypothetical protein F441_06253 [Phytophthora nicotianae CJ01A1]ETP47848.1 hypothetical protein F442_06292 [Phytophthora nicotianae P10297]